MSPSGSDNYQTDDGDEDDFRFLVLLQYFFVLYKPQAGLVRYRSPPLFLIRFCSVSLSLSWSKIKEKTVVGRLLETGLTWVFLGFGHGCRYTPNFYSKDLT